MKKVKLFFFSGTGNTWWIAKQLAMMLGDCGFEASAVSIESLSPELADRDIKEADIVGFGYPIYGSDLPLPMKNFIAKLTAVDAKPAIVFCSQWLWSGDGARVALEFLEPKGFDIRWAEHFLMPNNVSMFRWLPYTNNDRLIAWKLSGASKRGRRFVKLIEAGRGFRRGYNKVSELVGRVQRIPFRNALPKYQDCLQVDREGCTRCGYCVRLCPVNNFESIEDGTVITRKACILCLRCYNFCPVSAVKYKGKLHPRGKVPYRGPAGFNLEQTKIERF